MSWKQVKLGEISVNIQTGPFGSQLHQADYSETGFPVVMPKDLINGHISEESIARVDISHVKRLSKHKIQIGDILYSRRGDVGRCAFATEKEKGWLCGTGCLRVTIDAEKAIPQFVFYFLQMPNIVGWVTNHAVGSTMLNLNTTILNNIPLSIPEIVVQNRIVKILSAYDDLIENNQKQIKLLEEAAQRLYKEWFVDLRFPGYENIKVVDGVPEGWEKKTILDMSSVLRRGISPKYNDKGKYIVINQKCIRQTIMDIKESRQQEKEYPADMNLKDSDIVICSTGSGTLGRVGQVFGDYPDTTFDSHVTLVRAKKPAHSQFLFLTLKYLQPLLMTLGQGSTNQLELPKRVIESHEIICPTEKLIIDFESAILPIHNKITSLVSILKNATEARDRLLPKLMSGELEV